MVHRWTVLRLFENTNEICTLEKPTLESHGSFSHAFEYNKCNTPFNWTWTYLLVGSIYWTSLQSTFPTLTNVSVGEIPRFTPVTVNLVAPPRGPDNGWICDKTKPEIVENLKWVKCSFLFGSLARPNSASCLPARKLLRMYVLLWPGRWTK
jgi:hypothetical protein